MQKVIDRVVQYPNRYRLVRVVGTEDVYDLEPVEGDVLEEGTPISSVLFDSIAKDVNKLKGRAGTIQIDPNVTPLAPDSAGRAENTGTATDAVIKFSLPAGRQGNSITDVKLDPYQDVPPSGGGGTMAAEPRIRNAMIFFDPSEEYAKLCLMADIENFENMPDTDVIAVRTWRTRGGHGKKTEYRVVKQELLSTELLGNGLTRVSAILVEKWGSITLRPRFRSGINQITNGHYAYICTVELGHFVAEYANKNSHPDGIQKEYSYYASTLCRQENYIDTWWFKTII